MILDPFDPHVSTHTAADIEIHDALVAALKCPKPATAREAVLRAARLEAEITWLTSAGFDFQPHVEAIQALFKAWPFSNGLEDVQARVRAFRTAYTERVRDIPQPGEEPCSLPPLH
ncbi:MAG: hypothetical protein IPM35_20335 [Myxococcales bacterium]|nr:hypothetical protein [Myxococcales bacterium]